MNIKKIIVEYLKKRKKKQALKAWKEFIKHKRLPLP